MNTLLEPPSPAFHPLNLLSPVIALRLEPLTLNVRRSFAALRTQPFIQTKTAPTFRSRASQCRARQSFNLIRESK